MAEDGIDKVIRQMEEKGKTLDEGNKKTPPQRIDFVGTLKEIERQKPPTLSLFHVKEGDILRLTTGQEQQDGKIIIEHEDFQIVKPSQPSISIPGSSQQAEATAIQGDIIISELKRKTLVLTGSTFGGTALMTNAVMENAFMEYSVKDVVHSLTRHTLPVVNFEVLRIKDGEYQPVSLEELNRFEPSGDLQRFGEVNQLFAEIDNAFSNATQKQWQIHEISADGKNHIILIKDRKEEIKSIRMYSTDSQRFYRMSRFKGSHVGEEVYHIQVFDGVTEQQYANSFFKSETDLPYKRQYAYNVSNGDIDGSVVYFLGSEDVKYIGLEHGAILSIDRNGNVDTNIQDGMYADPKRARNIVKEFIIPNVSQDQIVIQYGEKQTTIPRQPDIASLQRLTHKAMGRNM